MSGTNDLGERRVVDVAFDQNRRILVVWAKYPNRDQRQACCLRLVSKEGGRFGDFRALSFNTELIGPHLRSPSFNRDHFRADLDLGGKSRHIKGTVFEIHVPVHPLFDERPYEQYTILPP